MANISNIQNDLPILYICSIQHEHKLFIGVNNSLLINLDVHLFIHKPADKRWLSTTCSSQQDCIVLWPKLSETKSRLMTA